MSLSDRQKFLSLALGAALFAAGCSTVSQSASTVKEYAARATAQLKEHVDFSFNGTVVYIDEAVVRGNPEVHIFPTTEVSGLKALVVPFRVTQRITEPELVGYAVSKGLWQTWAGMRVFDYMEFMPEAGPFRRDIAVRLAKARGADLVIGGFVTYLIPGAGKLNSSLAVQVEAYDVASGLMVWSMSHSGMLPADRTKDFMLFETKSRTPADPIQTINTAISADMGKIMRNWSKFDELANAKTSEPTQRDSAIRETAQLE